MALLRAAGNCLFFAIILIIYALVMAGGAYLAVIRTGDQNEEAQTIEASVMTSPDQLTNMPVGSTVTVTAVLEGNATLNDQVWSYLPAIGPYELVAYQADEWRIIRRNNNNRSSEWQPSQQTAPPLNMNFGGQSVNIAFSYLTNRNFDYGVNGKNRFTGNLHEFIQPYPVELTPMEDETAKYNGQDLPTRSVRIQGFKNGDTVTVVGQYNGSGIAPTRLHGGDSASLVTMLEDEAAKSKLYGYLIMGGATVVAPILVLVRLIGQRRKSS